MCKAGGDEVAALVCIQAAVLFLLFSCMLLSPELFAWAPGSAAKHGAEPLSKAGRKEATDAGFVIADREERPGMLMRIAFRSVPSWLARSSKGKADSGLCRTNVNC